MKKHIYPILVLLINGISLYSSETEISLKDYLNKITDENPKIISAKKLYESSKFNINYSYIPENPTIEFERMYIGDMNEKSFFIKQMVENPLKLKYSYDISKTKYKYQFYDYEEIKNDILTQAEISYYDYLFTLKQEDVYRKMLLLIDLLIENLKSSYISNNSKLIDILKLEAKYSEIKNEINIIENKKNTLYKKLLSFTGDDKINFKNELDEDIKFDINLNDLNSILLEKNLELSKKKELIKLFEYNYKLSKATYYPDFMFGYRKRYENNSSYDLIFGLSLPIFINKNSNKIKEQQYILRSSEKEFDDEVLKQKYNLEKYFLLLQTHFNSVNYYKQNIIPKLNAAIELSISSYENQNGSITDVLYSIDEKLKIELKYYEYIIEFYKTEAELNNILGRSLW